MSDAKYCLKNYINAKNETLKSSKVYTKNLIKCKKNHSFKESMI